MEDLEAVDELAHLLRKVQPGENIGIEPIFHLEVTSKVYVVEFVELVFDLLLGPFLHVGEVLLVGELAEILG